jgi:hypothetical protein
MQSHAIHAKSHNVMQSQEKSYRVILDQAKPHNDMQVILDNAKSCKAKSTKVTQNQ